MNPTNYKSRAWLAPTRPDEAAYCISHDGNSAWDPAQRHVFFDVYDGSSVVRIQQHYHETRADLIESLKTLQLELSSFIEHLLTSLYHDPSTRLIYPSGITAWARPWVLYRTRY
jgi:hypothetical protein